MSDSESKRDGKKRPPFPEHTGKATWGERTVPLDEFRRAARDAGRSLDGASRRRAAAEFLAGRRDSTPVEGPWRRIAVFGGVYSNRFALESLLEDASRRGAEAVYCLGDLGGFGPEPERVRPLLEQGDVRVIQGNYEESLAGGAEDCNCGYTDPRDNQFAARSYEYTAARSSPSFKLWMGELPPRRRVRVGKHELLLVHGSPRRINEFLFESNTPAAFIDVVARQERVAGFLCSHTGLHWRRTTSAGRHAVNVGVIGRPANDGRTEVWYAMVEERKGDLEVEFLPLVYDHVALAAAMRREELPEEFVETVLSGWWTTCLEILPARERASSRF